MAGSAETASDEARKFLPAFFNAATLPADAVSHHRREKHGARIEQGRQDRTHVSKYQSRERDGRGASTLLPPSRWHLGKTGLGKGGRRAGNFCLGKTEGGMEEIGGSQKEGRRKIRKAAHEIRTDARARSRAGKLSWVRTTFAHFLSRVRTA